MDDEVQFVLAQTVSGELEQESFTSDHLLQRRSIEEVPQNTLRVAAHGEKICLRENRLKGRSLQLWNSEKALAVGFT